MITTIVAEQCRRVFILVPSDLLRVQTVENCVKLGILKDIGVIEQRVRYPNVLCLKSQPRTKDELSGMKMYTKESGCVEIVVFMQIHMMK